MIKNIYLFLVVILFTYSNAYASWKHSNENFNSTNFSELSQINKENISKLEKIWQDKLPAAGSAPPMTFMYNECQYIVVNSTGGRFFSFKKNLDATVAYKLNTSKAFGD